MTTQYQLRIYNAAGVIQNIVTDVLALSYLREVNAPGQLTFNLDARHAAIANLDLDAQIEVWRRNPEQGLDWYCDFYAFWRGDVRQANDDGQDVYTAICPGQMDLLHRAIVAYPSNVANRSLFASAAAETIAKTLVQYNATVSGTEGEGRKRDVSLSGIVLEPDAGRGNTMDVACAWRNLLEVLQDIATNGDGDFDLVKTSAASWEFRWYADQLGTDRSDTVRFAHNYGNIASPVLTRNYMPERTVAIVGGQGQDNARAVVVRTGANYSAAHNATEVFVDARQATTTAALNQIGDVALLDAQMRNALTFNVLQVPQTFYGIHYFLGDLVTGSYEGVSATKQIRRVSVNMASEGQEQISVELRDV